MTPKKMTRHDMKRPDEFVSMATEAFEWMQNNIKTVLAIVALVLVAAVGVLAFVQYNRSQNDKAMYDYGRAVDGFHKAVALTGAERVKAIEESAGKLQAVYETFPSTRAADYALISIGEANFQLQKFEQSANAFEQAASRFEKLPSFKALALVGAGKSWEAQRNIDKALDFYQRANAVEGSPYKDVLKNDVGRLKVYKEQMSAAQASMNAAARPATAATGR